MSYYEKLGMKTDYIAALEGLLQSKKEQQLVYRQEQQLVHFEMEKVKTDIASIDHQIDIHRGLIIDKQSAQVASNEGTTASSPNSHMLPPEIQNHPLRQQVPVYHWFKGQPDPNKCISQYTQIMKTLKKIRRKMNKDAIKATRTEDGNTLNEDAYKVKGPLNQPFLIRITPYPAHCSNFVNEQTQSRIDEERILSELDGGSQEPDEMEDRFNGATRSLFSKMQNTLSLIDEKDDEDILMSEEEDNLPFNQSASKFFKSNLINQQSTYTSATTSNVRRRKDPLYISNRFKFTLAEDLVLQREVLPQINYSKEKLFANAFPMSEWQRLLDKHYPQRMTFELVRRCAELIDHKYQQSGLQSLASFRRLPTPGNFEEQKMDVQSQISHNNDQSRGPALSTKSEKRYILADRPWTQEENDILCVAVERHGHRSWIEVANYLTSRSPEQCRYQFNKVDPKVKREGMWNEAINDVKLIMGVEIFKVGNWSDISEHMFHKQINDLQCCERYTNILDSKIQVSAWTPEEDLQLLDLVYLHGPKWATISKSFQGKRTDNQCKRRARTLFHQKKRDSKGEFIPPIEITSYKRREKKQKAKKPQKEVVARIKSSSEQQEMPKIEKKANIQTKLNGVISKEKSLPDKPKKEIKTIKIQSKRKAAIIKVEKQQLKEELPSKTRQKRQSKLCFETIDRKSEISSVKIEQNVKVENTKTYKTVFDIKRIQETPLKEQ